MALDTQQDTGIRTGRTRRLPDPDGVEHVAKMQKAGGRGGEACGECQVGRLAPIVRDGPAGEIS